MYSLWIPNLTVYNPITKPYIFLNCCFIVHFITVYYSERLAILTQKIEEEYYEYF